MPISYVPHASIHTPDATIPAKYLELPEEKTGEHTFVTGHSGAGKSTLAHTLATQTGQPLVRLDFADPRYKEFFRADPAMEHLDPAKAKYHEFRNLTREILQKAISEASEPTIFEGTQIAQHSDLLGTGRKILVDPAEGTIVRRRLARDRAKAQEKGITSLAPGSTAARQRATVAKQLIAAYRPDIEAFRALPGVERFATNAIKTAELFHGTTLWKKADYAKGIPDRSDLGDLSKLRPGQLYDWIVQRHQAERAGEHYDVRFGNPDTGLYSWASRKGLPNPGEKRLAVQQPLHAHSYKGFEGIIPEGYGKGEVKKHDEGKVLLTKVEPGKIHFTVAHRRYPERYVLVKPQSTTGVGSKPNNWLLMNTTPTAPLPFEKEHYKSIPAEKVEPLLQNLQPGSSVQAKIDGALTLTQLLKDKLEVLSYRKSKVHGGPIVHTERTFHGIPNLNIPKEYQGSVLKGELYGHEQDNSPVPPQVLGGILNSSLAKSYTNQRKDKVNLKQMLFDVQQIGKKPVDFHKVPYERRIQAVRDILHSIGGPDAEKVRSTIHPPQEAKTPDEALHLYQEIASGKHPATEEGIVIHPPTGKPMKSKMFDEHDVYVRGFFPGKGKWTDKGIGGFVYSHEPKGQIVGEVGTGFTDSMRQDLFNNPNDYIGRVARVRTTGKLPSGALFQPSLIGFHEDYPMAEVSR